MDRAAFLDRDGVINRKAPEGEYITRWEEMEFLPSVAEGIALLNHSGFRVIVATNQRCIAKGIVTSAEVDALHQRMRDLFSAKGATIDAIYCCPHEKEPKCDCRKPEPGLLLQASREMGIDLSESWMIGDSDADIEAGRRAGCKTAFVFERLKQTKDKADLAAGSLLDCVKQILTFESSSGAQPSEASRSAASTVDVK